VAFCSRRGLPQRLRYYSGQREAHVIGRQYEDRSLDFRLAGPAAMQSAETYKHAITP